MKDESAKVAKVVDEMRTVVSQKLTEEATRGKAVNNVECGFLLNARITQWTVSPDVMVTLAKPPLMHGCGAEGEAGFVGL